MYSFGRYLLKKLIQMIRFVYLRLSWITCSAGFLLAFGTSAREEKKEAFENRGLNQLPSPSPRYWIEPYILVVPVICCIFFLSLKSVNFQTVKNTDLHQVQKNGDSFDYPLVQVKGGTFMTGSADDEAGRGADECTHTVTIQDFSIGKYEVSQKQWQSVMGYNPSEHAGCDECPVENISWDDVQRFIQKIKVKTGVTYRLPTEAEWEYAACGGNTGHEYLYSGSNTLDSVGWYTLNSGGRTHPAGSKNPNGLGIFDMSGNVVEWCSSWFTPYPGCTGTDRTGYYRILRGGSWYHYPDGCRTAERDYYSPDFRNPWVGFRLARSR